MACQNNGIFKGDDLIDLITINRPNGTDDIEIVKQVVQINKNPDLTFEKENPVYPYKISVLRDKSGGLDMENSISSMIYFNAAVDGEPYVAHRTLKGKLSFSANKKIVIELEEPESQEQD